MTYDRSDPKSIETYGKALIGQSFTQILDSRITDPVTRANFVAKYGNPKRKGGLGNFLEEVYFDYKANSDPRPDFHEAGVELKVSPYEITKKGTYKAGERLVLTMIDYKHKANPDLFSSHLWEKIATILLVYYHRRAEILSNLDYIINFVSLFSPAEEDLPIIEQDYLKIIQKVMDGRADELSESDTLYLAACTKGATAEKSLVSQEYYAPNRMAKKRAFSFKPSYMTSVLNGMVAQAEEEKILADKAILQHQTFEEYTLGLISQYIGKTDEELCQIFDRPYNNNKAQWSELAYRMLGIKSNQAVEFTKANIVVKIIRLEKNGSMRESISLPTIHFKDLTKEEWEDSTLRDYFEETRFFFVIYQHDGAHYKLHKAKFWNMPISDLDGDLKACWDATVKFVREGVVFTQNSNSISNNLPSSKDNRISHIRPHANKSYYRLNDGTSIGDVTHNGDELPDGQWMTKQSFWLNRSYVIEEIVGKDTSL